MNRIYHWSEWAAYKTIDSEDEMRNFLSQFDRYIARSVVRDRPEFRLIAVEMHPMALEACPKSSQTYELVKAALKGDSAAIRFASKKVLKAHPELYKVAISNCGAALAYVPEEFRYEGIYGDAVSTYGRAIGHIPSEAITPELIAVAINQDPSALELIPDELLDYQTCMTAVRSLGKILAVVPANLVDRDMCLAAVSCDGMAIEYVPDAFCDRSMQLAAVKCNGLALGAIPTRRRSRAVCESAVAANALALEYVPPRFASSELVYQAVATNGLALRFVENPEQKLCDLAVENDGTALRYVPEAYKSQAMCRNAFEKNWRMITHIPAPMVGKDMLLRAISEEAHKLEERPFSERIMNLSFYEQLNPDLSQDPEVAVAQRAAGIRRTISAVWDEGAKCFLVDDELIGREFVSGFGYEDLTFPLPTAQLSFEALCSYLGGILDIVDFGSFDLSGIEALPECVVESTIPSDALVQIGAYDEEPYRRLIEIDKSFATELFSEDYDNDCMSLENVDSPLDRYYLSDETPIYYVSDIHLNHKLVKKFPNHASENEIARYISGFVDSMLDTVPSTNRHFPLLVLGDVSYNFSIAEKFFTDLGAKWRGPIVCVLGNHELWYSSPSPKPTDPVVSVESIVEEYREMLGRHNVVLLENELFVKYRNREYAVVSINELRAWSDVELQNYLRRCSTILIGGIGFTALSDKFTAKDGLYRNTLRTLQEDEAYTAKFREFYERIVNLVPDKTVIVATHTPMRCWSLGPRHPGWIYLNGHTHRNTCELTDSYSVYEDNQIGYHAMSAGLKRFLLHPVYDVFKYHNDGIHVVNRIDYLDFCRECGVSVGSFTRKGDVYMLKRDGLYCFLLKMEANGKYYLLAGGRIHSLAFQDPEHYFERMKIYSDRTKAAFSGYNKAIRVIGDEIRRLGGTGNVHGCIVDIDFLNHIYLDPFTGELKFYYAESISERVEYPSLDLLLNEHAKSLLPAYNRLVSKSQSKGTNNQALISLNAVPSLAKSPTISRDTSMYRPSGIVRSVQYLFDTNIIRIWNDAVLAGVTDDEIAASNAAPKRLYGAHDHSLNS